MTFLIKILKTLGLSQAEVLALMYASSCQNKLNVNKKEKKMTTIYIREKNHVSRQVKCMYSINKTVFIRKIKFNIEIKLKSY